MRTMAKTRAHKPATAAQPHFSAAAAAAFVDGGPVPAARARHLQASCDACHERIYAAFDAVLRAVDAGADRRRVADWLAALGERFARRHCCPVDLMEDLERGDARALRHVRHCPLCAAEVADLAALADASSKRRRRG